MEKLVVSIKDFEGPLDLLLHLIKEKEMDILNLDLQAITKQYLAFVMDKSKQEIDEISSYLPLAAYLIELQSKRLLPTSTCELVNESDETEAARQKLIKRLIEYQKFKAVSNYFLEKAAARKLLYSKPTNELETLLVPKKLTWENISITKLSNAMLELSKNQQIKTNAVAINLTLNVISAAERAKEITAILRAKSQKTFTLLELCNLKMLTLHYFVVTFIAILDLVRKQIVSLVQTDAFGPIVVKYKKEGYYKNE